MCPRLALCHNRLKSELIIARVCYVSLAEHLLLQPAAPSPSSRMHPSIGLTVTTSQAYAIPDPRPTRAWPTASSYDITTFHGRSQSPFRPLNPPQELSRSPRPHAPANKWPLRAGPEAGCASGPQRAPRPTAKLRVYFGHGCLFVCLFVHSFIYLTVCQAVSASLHELRAQLAPPPPAHAGYLSNLVRGAPERCKSALRTTIRLFTFAQLEYFFSNGPVIYLFVCLFVYFAPRPSQPASHQVCSPAQSCSTMLI